MNFHSFARNLDDVLGVPGGHGVHKRREVHMGRVVSAVRMVRMAAKGRYSRGRPGHGGAFHLYRQHLVPCAAERGCAGPAPPAGADKAVATGNEPPVGAAGPCHQFESNWLQRFCT